MSWISRLGLGLLVLLGPMACGEDSSLTDPQQPILGVPASSQSSLQDDEISTTDTYFAFDVTEESSTSEPDAMATRYVELGYEIDGTFRFNAYRDPSTDARYVPPALIRSVGDDIYIWDQSGSLVLSTTFAAAMEHGGFPGGSLVDATPNDNLYLEYDPGGDDPTQPLPEPGSLSPGDPSRIFDTNTTWEVEGNVLTAKSALRLPLPAGLDARQRAARSERARTTRRYRQRPMSSADGGPPIWLLDEVERTLEIGGVEHRSVTRYSYRQWHVNLGRDRNRKAALEAASQSAAQSRPVVASTISGSIAPQSEEMALLGVCEQGVEDFSNVPHLGGQPVVWQHGFCSTALTFNALRALSDDRHEIGVEQGYSLNSTDHLENQTDTLATRLDGRGTLDNLVIGHSQGGLVARRLGQKRPDLVKGVVTIGTPHFGAPIAQAGSETIANAITDATDDLCDWGFFICAVLSEVQEEVVSGFITWGVGELVPAAGDDQPGSSFLTNLNSTPEAFRRASISVNVPFRWSWARLVGDNGSDRSLLVQGQPLKGQEWASDVEAVFNFGWFLRDIAQAIRFTVFAFGPGWDCSTAGYATYWGACSDPNWIEASVWLTVANILDTIGSFVTGTLNSLDRIWLDLTIGNGWSPVVPNQLPFGEGTDGFLPYTTQLYPGDPSADPGLRWFEILNSPESHSGQTGSLRVLLQLREALSFHGVDEI